MMPSDFNSLIDRLPHVGAMRLIDSVSELNALSARTVTVFDERRATIRPLDEPVADYLGIELVAQSAALPLICSSREDEVHRGMIVQVKSFQSYGLQLDGVVQLETHCQVESLLDGKMAAVDGQVFSSGELCCEVKLTLALEVARDG